MTAVLLLARVPAALAECPTTDGCVPAPNEPTVEDALHDDPAGAAALVALVNKERVGAGLGPVTPRTDVTDIAQAHSREMAQARAIWHSDSYFSEQTKRALGASALGENVSFNRSIPDAHDQFMQSPGHRANILDPRYSVVGFAITRGTDGISYITEDFIAVGPSQAPAPKHQPKVRMTPVNAPPAVATVAAAPSVTPVVATPIAFDGVVRPPRAERAQLRRAPALEPLRVARTAPALLVVALALANLAIWVFAVRVRRSIRA